MIISPLNENCGQQFNVRNIYRNIYMKLLYHINKHLKIEHIKYQFG